MAIVSESFLNTNDLSGAELVYALQGDRIRILLNRFAGVKNAKIFEYNFRKVLYKSPLFLSTALS
jgi:hypothetical protein